MQRITNKKNLTNMKKITVLASLSLILGLAACSQDKQAELAKLKKEQADITAQIAQLEQELGVADAPAQQKPAVPVSVLTVQSDTFRQYLEVQGRVDFDQNANVSARVPGILTEVRVQRGDQVKKGQILASIDARLVQQGIQELETQLDLARTIYEKQKNLWDQKIGTEVQYLTAKNNKEGLERRLSTMREQYDQYRIRAPFAGVVDEVMPKLGEAVSPGVPLFRVVNTNNGKIVADVSENYLASIKRGDEAMVYLPDLGREISTQVRVVSQSVNPSSRAFTVELSVKPEDQREISFRPNMVAVVRIQNYINQKATVVPVNVVQRDETSTYVFTVEKEGDQFVARKKTVTTGKSYQGQMEVTEGLAANDQIITRGYQNLNDGQPVSFELAAK
jgi:RND family efflux transporter MFP subunit